MVGNHSGSSDTEQKAIEQRAQMHILGDLSHIGGQLSVYENQMRDMVANVELLIQDIRGLGLEVQRGVFPTADELEFALDNYPRRGNATRAEVEAGGMADIIRESARNRRAAEGKGES